MRPEEHSTGGQDPAPSVSQPIPGVSSAAQRYMSLRAEAQPGSAPAAVQPGEGQGAGEGGGTPNGDGGGFNWDLFPDVPEEQRSLLEPHLKNVQGHVTKLEQQYSPLKPLVEQGISAEDAQGLVQLNQSFDRDPMGTWLRLGEQMQKAGVLNDDLDLEAVGKILNGEDVEEEGGEGGEGEPTGEEIPEWAKPLIQHVQSQQQREQQEGQERQNQQRTQILEKAMGEMKAQLTQSGYTEDQLTDELLRGTLIAYKGDQNAATQHLVDLRSNVLKTGLGNGKGSNGQGGDGPEMPKGPPSTPKPKGRGPGREFAEARAGAEQMLKSKQNAEAQGT